MTSILFINPPLSKKEEYGDLSAAGSSAPPLGLVALASISRSEGYPATVLDAPTEGLDLEATVARIVAARPDVVGITITAPQYHGAAALARRTKEELPRTIVIAGGSHPTWVPEESLLKCPYMDLLVLGEGEETLREILSAREQGREFRDIPGVAFLEDGRVRRTPPRPMIEDLDSLPLPVWDVLDNFPQRYPPQLQSVVRYPSTSISTSRGCSGQCTFCDTRVFGKHPRAFSAAYVMEIIRDLYHNYGIRNLQFEDENFLLHRKRLFELCSMLKEEALDLTWSCLGRADMVREDVCRSLKEAGCWSVQFGIESTDPGILDLMKKNLKLDQVRKAIEIAHDAGLKTKGFFITGFFGETRETLDATQKFIMESDLDDIGLAYFTPFPGCAAWEDSERWGTLDKDWRKLNFYMPVFTPRGLTREDLIAHNKKTYRMFYLQPRVIMGYIRRLRQPKLLLNLLRGFFAFMHYSVFSRKEM
jgi:anaerobic magnesium-protoporphyrin IX monomethyl ester cyclase